MRIIWLHIWSDLPPTTLQGVFRGRMYHNSVYSIHIRRGNPLTSYLWKHDRQSNRSLPDVESRRQRHSSHWKTDSPEFDNGCRSNKDFNIVSNLKMILNILFCIITANHNTFLYIAIIIIKIKQKNTYSGKCFPFLFKQSLNNPSIQHVQMFFFCSIQNYK